MLNKPKFMTPSTNMQECSVDLNENNVPFSCIVDGNEAVIAWQIIVYDINNGQSVFDSDKVTLESPFYPVDEKNRNVVFNINLKDYLNENSSFVNRKDAYSWTITFWGTSGAPITSCEEVFYAITKPSVSISFKESNDTEYATLTENTILKSRGCSFKGYYSQENGVALKRYGWKLCDTDSGQTLVDTISHNQIYGTSENILCLYNGFLNGGNYSIELYIETQDNTTIKTAPIKFMVSYKTTFLNNDLRVSALKRESSIMLDWSEALVIGGRSEGDISFETNYPIIDYSSENPSTSINIPENSRVIFDYGSSSNLDINENCYVVLSTQLRNDNNTTLFYAEGSDSDGLEVSRKLSFENGRFEYRVKASGENIVTSSYPDGSTEFTITPNKHVWYIIIMAPMLIDENGSYYTELAVVESKLINGLYPSSSRCSVVGAGVFDNNHGYVEINGVKHTSAFSTQVNYGDEITVRVGAQTSDLYFRSEIYVNGEMIVGDAGEYNITITGNTTINFEKKKAELIPYLGYHWWEANITMDNNIPTPLYPNEDLYPTAGVWDKLKGVD